MASVNDIFNRPPTISEDLLHYTLYLPSEQSDRVSATTLAALLLDHIQSLINGLLWHRDAFELKVAPDPEGNADCWVLEGRMRVGDCIDDEWCTVWLLRELSSKWDLVISIFDSDGEFLLIEAAEELPSWVTPTNAENRVWIHNSRLHLVPLSHISPPSSKTRRRKYVSRRDSDDEDNIAEDQDEDELITATDAVKLVRESYPTALRQHTHVTKAYLPVDVTKALAVNPSFVQKAVETFYTRDALQLRASQKMSRFPPEPANLVSVKMTRTAYAQLIGQKFHPPKVFGRWAEREGTKEWRWRDVGMKIACGFEMLYQESKSRKETTSINFDGSPASLAALKDSLRRNPEYAQYIQRLVSAGYFKGELEGSQLWVTLESQAASAFVAARRDDDASRPSFATLVQAAIVQYKDDRPSPPCEEDSDEWLNVDVTDLDATLEKTLHGERVNGKENITDAMDVDDDENRVTKLQAERLRDLAHKVEDFLEGEGDLEGARFADEAFSDDEDNDSDDTEDAEADDTGMDQDDDVDAPKSSTSQLTKEQLTARQAAMDKLVPALDPSEYGKMPPSYHSNSQRVAPVTMESDIRETSSSDPADASFSTPLRPIRPPILPRNAFDGVDSDDESDEDDPVVDEEDEEEQPQVVGEVEIDMGEEEDEFIEFARQALGVSDEQWKEIIEERRERGAFVPTRIAPETAHDNRRTPKPFNTIDATSKPPVGGGDRLTSFDEVMKAMDAELERARGERQEGQRKHASDAKGKGKARENDDSSMDIEAAMEAELEGLLEQGQGDDEDGDGDENGEVDYQLIKNFLESFKSQGGLSGPVSSLVGRLQQGWTLPRDDQ
uniref:SGT1-domain-containing protein n=1 Tax=Ganoderma boninense TaxID=34458 RepID=A0A5K1JR94_9APHY|nr:Uncharacterized protein [Ganoderma boninense]